MFTYVHDFCTWILGLTFDKNSGAEQYFYSYQNEKTTMAENEDLKAFIHTHYKNLFYDWTTTFEFPSYLNGI